MSEARLVRSRVYVLYREPTEPIAPVLLGRVKSEQARARMTRDLSSAVAFCALRGVKLAVHPVLIRVSAHGLVCEIGDAPDSRFDPPERTGDAAWAIGCVLHKMITGRAPVTLHDLASDREMVAIVRCLGAPTMSESLALGIPPPNSARRRATVRGASLPERALLRSTLAWDPERRMVCGPRGLVSALGTVWE